MRLTVDDGRLGGGLGMRLTVLVSPGMKGESQEVPYLFPLYSVGL